MFEFKLLVIMAVLLAGLMLAGVLVWVVARVMDGKIDD